MADVFDLIESSNQGFCIISISDKAIIESHGLEQVVIRLAVGFTQLTESSIHSTVDFGNRLIVIIEHDDEVRTKLTYVVKTFECFTATH